MNDHELVGPASPVRDPAPPDAIRRVLERFERTDCDDQSGGYESSCDECDGKGEAGRAETIAHKPNCVIGGLRGVRDPSPPEPTDREIGLRSALNAALVDLRIFRGVDDHFVQALEKLVEQTGVRGAGVVPPELDQSERVPVRDTTPISDGEPAQAEPARLPASPAAPDYVYSSPEATTFVSWLSDQQRNGWCSSEVYDRVRDELNRTVPAAPAPPETERLWALVTQWREAAEYCRTPPTREEIALLWDRVADELKAVLGGSRPSLAGSGLAKLEAARCTLGGSSRTETTWLQARRELAEAYVALRGAEPGRIL